MATLAFVAQAGALFGLFAAGVAVAIGAAHRRLAPAVRRLAPATRARVLLLVAAMPALLAVVFLAIAILPKVVALSFGVPDHCASHGGHAHLCPVHPFDGTLRAIAAVPLAGLAASAIALAWSALRTHSALQALASIPGAAETDGTVRVRAARPFAFTAGLLRPSIFVSTGLRDALAPEELAIVIAHERAHVRRRDALTVRAAAWLSALHLPALRREILSELRAACEQACDEDAACGGDRLRVAATIVQVARLQGDAAPWPSLAFGDGDVGTRVAALLAPAIEEPLVPRERLWLAAAAFGCVGAALASPLHHAAETLVAFLSH